MVDYKIVASSNVAAVGYDGQEKCLYVRFLSKKAGVGSSEYCYKNVGQEVFDEIMAADSKGSAVHRLLKGRYEFERV